MSTIVRLLVLLAAAAVSVASAVPAQQQQGSAGPEGDGTGCRAACAHYFQCKGIDDQAQVAECAGECERQGADATQTYAFTQMDCATAIQTVEEYGGPGGAGEGQGGESPSGGACTADCTGCMYDGTECYSGHAAAGAGTVIPCDACCCAPGGPAHRWE